MPASSCVISTQSLEIDGLLAAFSRFLESAGFSQAAPLNVAEVARDVGVDRKTAAAYFDPLEDLLIATRLPVFTKRAKRRMTAHSSSSCSTPASSARFGRPVRSTAPST